MQREGSCRSRRSGAGGLEQSPKQPQRRKSGSHRRESGSFHRVDMTGMQPKLASPKGHEKMKKWREIIFNRQMQAMETDFQSLRWSYDTNMLLHMLSAEHYRYRSTQFTVLYFGTLFALTILSVGGFAAAAVSSTTVGGKGLPDAVVYALIPSSATLGGLSIYLASLARYYNYGSRCDAHVLIVEKMWSSCQDLYMDHFLFKTWLSQHLRKKEADKKYLLSGTVYEEWETEFDIKQAKLEKYKTEHETLKVCCTSEFPPRLVKTFRHLKINNLQQHDLIYPQIYRILWRNNDFFLSVYLHRIYMRWFPQDVTEVFNIGEHEIGETKHDNLESLVTYRLRRLYVQWNMKGDSKSEAGTHRTRQIRHGNTGSSSSSDSDDSSTDSDDDSSTSSSTSSYSAEYNTTDDDNYNIGFSDFPQNQSSSDSSDSSDDSSSTLHSSDEESQAIKESFRSRESQRSQKSQRSSRNPTTISSDEESKIKKESYRSQSLKRSSSQRSLMSQRSMGAKSKPKRNSSSEKAIKESAMETSFRSIRSHVSLKSNKSRRSVR